MRVFLIKLFKTLEHKEYFVIITSLIIPAFRDWDINKILILWCWLFCAYGSSFENETVVIYHPWFLFLILSVLLFSLHFLFSILVMSSLIWMANLDKIWGLFVSPNQIEVLINQFSFRDCVQSAISKQIQI